MSSRHAAQMGQRSSVNSSGQRAWLAGQLVSEADRRHLSARYIHLMRRPATAAAATSVKRQVSGEGAQQQQDSPAAPTSSVGRPYQDSHHTVPQTASSDRPFLNRRTGRDPPSPPRSQAVRSPAAASGLRNAEQLVDALGQLGYQCKQRGPPPAPGSNKNQRTHNHGHYPQRQLPGEISQGASTELLAQASWLAAVLVPHVRAGTLSPGDMCHCCWSLAQFGPAAGRDTNVRALVQEVQWRMLLPAQRPGARAGRVGDEGGVGDRARGRREQQQQEEEGAADGSREAGRGEPLIWDLQPKEVSKLAWACAKLFGPDQVLLQPPPQQLEQSAPLRDAQQPGRRQVQEQQGQQQQWGPEQGPQGQGQTRLRRRRRMSEADAGREQMEQEDQQQRATTGFWDVLGHVAARQIRELAMPPQALCNVLWAFATAGRRHAGLVLAAAECIAAGHRSRYEPVGISNLCWAFATLRFYPAAQGAAAEAAGEGRSSASGSSTRDTGSDVDASRGMLEDDMGLGGDGFGFPFGNDLATIHAGSSSSSNNRRSSDTEHRSGGVSPSEPTDDSDLYGAEGRALYDGLYGALERLAAGHVRDMSQQQLANTAWGLVVAGRGRAARQLLGSIAGRAGELAEGACAGAGSMSLQPNGSDQRRGPQQPHRPRLDPHAVSVLAWSLSAARQDVSPLLRAVARVSGVARPDQAGPGPGSQGGWDDSSSTTITTSGDGGGGELLGADPDGNEADPRSQPGGAAPSGGGLGAFSDQDLSMLCIAHHRAWRAAAAAARREAGRAGPRAAADGAGGRGPRRAMGLGSGAEAERGAGEAEAPGVGREGGAPGPYCPELVWAVRDEVIRRAHRMDMQALANICYCLADLNYYHEAMYGTVAAAAAGRLAGCTPRTAARLMWALARARHYSPQLMAAYAAAVRPHLRSPALTPVDLAATAAAFAAFNHYDPPLLRELCARVAQLARVPDPTATPPTPPAAARAGGARGRHRSNDGGHGDGGGDGARRGEKKGGDSGGGGGLPPRVLIHVLWCCAVLSHVDEGMLGALYGRLAGMDLSGLSVPGIMQLFQAQLMLQDTYGGVTAPPQVLTHEQMELARATWRRVTRAATTTSALHAQVASALERLGCRPTLERVTTDGLFSFDMAATWAGRNVAVEVDGPSHFTRSRPYRPLGRTLAKRRCLEARGWRVLSVPGHEWRQLPSQEAQEAYLRAALDGALWRTHVLGEMPGLRGADRSGRR